MPIIIRGEPLTLCAKHRLEAHLRKPRRSRYGINRVRHGERSFASKAERDVFQELELLEKSGAIRDLKCQVSFALVVNGVKLERYVADFTATDARTGKLRVWDAKAGMYTTEFRRKVKWMKAAHGIDVEVIDTKAKRNRAG